MFLSCRVGSTSTCFLRSFVVLVFHFVAWSVVIVGITSHSLSHTSPIHDRHLVRLTHREGRREDGEDPHEDVPELVERPASSKQGEFF